MAPRGPPPSGQGAPRVGLRGGRRAQILEGGERDYPSLGAFRVRPSPLLGRTLLPPSLGRGRPRGELGGGGWADLCGNRVVIKQRPSSQRPSPQGEGRVPLLPSGSLPSPLFFWAGLPGAPLWAGGALGGGMGGGQAIGGRGGGSGFTGNEIREGGGRSVVGPPNQPERGWGLGYPPTPLCRFYSSSPQQKKRAVGRWIGEGGGWPDPSSLGYGEGADRWYLLPTSAAFFWLP